MGMVSFISTVPTLLSMTHLSSPNNTTSSVSKFPSHMNTTRCLIEADNVSVTHTRRRDLLNMFGATIGMGAIASPISYIDVANAADLIQRQQRSAFQCELFMHSSSFLPCVEPLWTQFNYIFFNSKYQGYSYTALKGKQELVPSLLILALNDAITYDKATKSGGPNGSIRFSSEINRPENKGLSAAMNFLEDAKKEIDLNSKGGPISFSDLIQFAAQSAVKATFIASAIRKCGGNEEKGSMMYSAYGSTGQWGLFDRAFGRSDAQEPDPEGRVPLWENASVQEMKDKFSFIGFGPRQLAVMSAFLGPDQKAIEALLITDRDVAPWVDKYQRSRETVSQTDYEVDLITTLTKLSSLGQQINYEAYTYPVKKVDFSKLKL